MPDTTFEQFKTLAVYISVSGYKTCAGRRLHHPSPDLFTPPQPFQALISAAIH